MTGIVGLIFGRFRPLENKGMTQFIAASLLLLGLRLLLAKPFWASGQTRWVNFPTDISGSTLYLFQNEFILHFGLFDMPIPFPVLVAWMTALAEIVLPVLLVLGIATRLWALALLAMSIVIQLVFPEGFINVTDWMNSHALWMAYALVIVICGPGALSLDQVLRRTLFGRNTQAAM